MLSEIVDQFKDIDILKIRKRHLKYIAQEYELNYNHGFFNKTIEHDKKEFETKFNLMKKDHPEISCDLNKIIDDFIKDSEKGIQFMSVLENGTIKKFSCLCYVKNNDIYNCFSIYTYDKDNNLTGEFEELLYFNNIFTHIAKSKQKGSGIEIAYSPYYEECTCSLHLRYYGDVEVNNDSPIFIPVQNGYGKLIMFDNRIKYYSVLEGIWVNN